MYFENIQGHKQQTEQLIQMLKRKCLPHALLFAGPSCIGKKTIAISLATALLSGAAQNDLTQLPANEQNFISCKKLVYVGNHPDLHFVSKSQDKKDIPVEDIRTLRNMLELKPYQSPCSVAIIDDAHLMTVSASNALLMTLEEPSGASYIILVSNNIHKLPETIISRCQIVYFSALKQNEVKEVLSSLLSPISKDLDLINELASICSNSLEALNIQEFLEPKTSKIINPKDMISHLQNIKQKLSQLRSNLHSLIANDDSSDLYGKALSLASTLADDKESLPLAWQIIYKELRKQLRSCPLEKINRKADNLLKAIEAHQLTQERNLNPQMQLSNLFVNFA